jgi:hypothetical protein
MRSSEVPDELLRVQGPGRTTVLRLPAAGITQVATRGHGALVRHACPEQPAPLSALAVQESRAVAATGSACLSSVAYQVRSTLSHIKRR